MALAGARPIAEIQFEGFSYPAFDQMASDLGRIRFRTRGNSSLPMVMRMPNGDDFNKIKRYAGIIYDEKLDCACS